MFKQPNFRWFQCSLGEKFETNHDCLGQYIKNGEPYCDTLHEENYLNSNNDVLFTFFDRTFEASVWLSDIQIIFSFIRKEIALLEPTPLKSDAFKQITDFTKIRKNICEVLLASRVLVTRPKNMYHIIQAQSAPVLKNILSNIKRLKELPDYVVFNSVTATDLIHYAPYNYLHLSLDMYWINLTIDHYNEDDPIAKLEIFERNLIELLSDLIHVAFRKFERLINHADLLKHSPFPCSCFKELWLLIQLYVEKLHIQQFCKDFWYYFNETIKNEKKILNGNNCIQSVECIWLLYHVARLQGYERNGTFIGSRHHRVVSNYSLIGHCLKISISGNSSQIDEQLMCSCLHLLVSLHMDWWKKDANFDLLQILWEYFYKRLNSSFGVVNDTATLINTSQKPCDYSELTENILKYDLDNPLSLPATSYDIFLCLLGKYLTNNPSHWPKLKGRIYSKLPASKLAAFTDSGLQNLVQLFFVLAYTVNFNELTDKLQSLLNQLPVARSENSSVIWNAQIYLLIMRAQRGMALNGTAGAEICAPILLAVQSASSDRSRSHLMRIYIEGIKKLIDNERGLACQGHVLFGSWISRYLLWCLHSDACHLLDIFKTLIEKLQNIGSHQEWWTAIEIYVVPSIIQLSTVPDAPLQVVELAATLILADGQRFKNVLEHMTGDVINISLSVRFLTFLSEQNKYILNQFSDQQNFLIQAWVRIAVLSTNKSDLTELTLTMSHLPQWSETIGSFDVKSTEDPLYAVIRLAGCRMRDAQTIMDNFALKRWFETYFGKMDRWAAPVLVAAERGDNAQLVLRIYTCAALMFLHCAPALYVKNKNTCLLYRITSTLLLPAAVLVNKRPANVILAALRRTWHLFVRSIARLDYKNDNYIERTLRDMVIRYVPHMNDSSSPLLRCLDVEFENSATSFIIDKIANTFLTCKSKNAQEFSNQALKLILEMSRIRTDMNKAELFVRIILPSLFEQLIFIEDINVKHAVNQIIESIKSNSHFLTLREIFKNSLLIVIDKHLAFYSANIFRFMESLIIVIPIEIENVLPNLQEAIQKVERMRGVGYDSTLRKGLQRIQEVVNQNSK